MISKQILKEIHSLTETLIRLNLSIDQNFPTTLGTPSRSFEINVANSEKLTSALKNVPYREIFSVIESSRSYNIRMIDGALIILRYKFHNDSISEHVLSYFSSPNLESFQNEPEIYLEDVIYADIIDRSLVCFPMRFDYSSDVSKYVDGHHPYSHASFGQYKNCRIPVCSPVTPVSFGSFILRNFYNTAFRKFSDELPNGTLRFPKSISRNEMKMMHIVCS